MPLADDSGNYRFLVFDFDAHDAPLEAAQRDVDEFTAMLDDVGSLPYVLCESSPGRGYHVWLSVADPVTPAFAAVIGAVAKRLHPTLDTIPLNGAGTGTVRPPGSPHRFGGHSTVLRGRAEDLASPAITGADVERLANALEDRAPAPPDDYDVTDVAALVLIDADGHAYLPGSKRSLGAAAHQALTSSVPAQADHSAVMWTVLLGAARARWHYSDLHPYIAAAPGLEYARTERGHGRRMPRAHDRTTGILERQWHRAVQRVSRTRLNAPPKDSLLEAPRIAVVTGVVQAAQAHANNSPGAWTHTPGATRGAGQQRAIDRAVLDELHRRALKALTTSVGVSVRTLAMSLTVGRESVRQALLRLDANGWLALEVATDGPAAAVWSIDPERVFHKEVLTTWSAMGGHTPHRLLVSEALRTRSALVALMDRYQDNATHDAFTPAALGPQAGRIYAGLSATGPCTAPQLATSLALPADVAGAALDELAYWGLAGSSGPSWVASPPDHRDAVAVDRQTVGTLEERRYRYILEQATWAYWQAEVALTSRATALSPGRLRVVSTPSVEPIRLGPYPRRSGSRGHHREARDLIERLRVA